MQFDEIKIEKLSRIHDTSKFDCGDEDINEFLKKDALMWQERKLAVTRIFVYNDEIIGFSCTSADSIKLDLEERKNENGLDQKKMKEVPAIKIGRLGRSLKYKDQKVGEFILKWTIGHVLELSDSTGIRFVTVDSYPKKVEWYELFGFKQNLNGHYKKSKNVSMRFCLLNPPK